MPTKPVILAIDDEPRILEAMADILETDFTVISAQSGGEGLKILSERHDVSVVLCDQRMPGMHGDEFFGKAREFSNASRVMVTGYADLAAVIRAVNDGQIHTYLAKPFRVEDLVLAVRSAHKGYEMMVALQQERDLLHSLMDSTSDLICFKDGSGQFIRINKAMSGQLGLAGPESAIGLRETDCLPPDQAAAVRDTERRVIAGGVAIREVGQESDEGNEGRWWSTVTVPVRDGNGAIKAMIGIKRDVTEVRRLEEEARAGEAALAASQAKTEFLSRMSHELRTPLNAILGFAQLLTYDPDDAEAESVEFGQQILTAGQHLLYLIDEVLDLARIESGTVNLSVGAIDLDELLLECRNMIAPLAEPGDIRLVFPQAAGTAVLADRARLRQVLLNLLSNGIKYNRKGGRLAVAVEPAGPNRIRISVEDGGNGLDQAQIGSLFQPFNRLGQEHGPVEGTGMGLVVTKSLVELMGGTIAVSSTVGEGTVFSVELPAAAAEGPTEPAMRRSERAASRFGQGMPLVLYVEDNQANRELVEHIVRVRGDLRLITAADGKQGIDLAREHLPAAILLDLHLPRMDGFSVFKILSADPRTRHIPVIVLSASAMPQDIKKGTEAGFFGYLTKPIEVETFNRLLDSALARATARL